MNRVENYGKGLNNFSVLGFPIAHHRRIEDKLDALGIYSELVMLRMAEPPGQKHVPLQFPAWVCMDEGSKDTNIFKSCQLLLDRWDFKRNRWMYEKHRPCFDSFDNVVEWMLLFSQIPFKNIFFSKTSGAHVRTFHGVRKVPMSFLHQRKTLRQIQLRSGKHIPCKNSEAKSNCWSLV